MEEKETKKKNNTKTAKAKTTQRKTATKSSTKKTSASKSASATRTRTRKTNTTSTKKKTTPSTTKKKTATSELPKKQVEKTNVKPENKIEKEVEKISKEEKDILLEKTIIFDGTQSKNLSDVVNKLEEDKVVLDDRVIKRSKARKVIIIILVIAMLAVAGITAKYVTDQIAESKRIKETLNSNIYAKASEKYEKEEDVEDSENSDLIKDIKYENIETITLSDFEKKALNKEDMIVLVASTTCYSCITFEPVIDEVFNDLGKTIYRLNITSMSKDDVTRFRTYYAFKSTPTIFVIRDGIVVADVRGAMNEENLKRWLDENL